MLTNLDAAVRKIKALGSSSPVSAMNAAEAEWRRISDEYVKEWNSDSTRPRMF